MAANDETVQYRVQKSGYASANHKLVAYVTGAAVVGIDHSKGDGPKTGEIEGTEGGGEERER